MKGEGMEYTNSELRSYGECQRTAEIEKETVKSILINNGEILSEMNREIDMIADALYRGKSVNNEVKENEPKEDPPLSIWMRGQRDTAEEILKKIVKIREALW